MDTTSRVAPRQINSGNKLIDNQELQVDSNVTIQLLKEQLDSVNIEFHKANEERAKAAEYGLVLLEQKQTLQNKNEEMTILYERTKHELDTSTSTLRQLQRDYEKRVKDVERQREDLISEMEGRERELMSKVETLEEEKRGFERTMKKLSSQNDYVTESNCILSNENERLKQELSTQKEEFRILKRKNHDTEIELQQSLTELDISKTELDKLLQCQRTLDELNEHNQSLQNNLSILQDQLEHVAEERDDLERQKRDIVQALNEEREVKSFLETKLREDMLSNSHGSNWLIESLASNRQVPIPDGQVPVSVSVPTSPTIATNQFPPTHSTPLQPGIPNLFSEIQSANRAPATQHSDEYVIELNGKLQTMEHEVVELTQKVESLSKENNKWRSRCKKIKEEKTTEVESLADELSAKKEICTQLVSQLSVANREKASFEIEIDGLKEEIKRNRDTAKMENEKLEKEFLEEQAKCEQLLTKVGELDERVGMSVTTCEKLESILANSTNEVLSIINEIANLQQEMSSLQKENQAITSTLPDNELGHNDTYVLSVLDGKKKLKILKGTHTVEDVSRLKELLRQLRSPLEAFTKKMLESSLVQSSKVMGTSSGEVPVGVATSNEESPKTRKLSELESNLNKARASLANRTEEVNQLRAIMKARQTTSDVTVTSLKSKLDGQKRAHEAEVNQYKHKIKTLRKERDDQISLGALTSRRCQEYIDEISKVKRRVDELRGDADQLRNENKLLAVYLDRSIKQKLNISQELERYREEEERTRVIPLTLSSSRV